MNSTFYEFINMNHLLSERPKAFGNISDKGIKGNNKYSPERRREDLKDCVALKIHNNFNKKHVFWQESQKQT